MNPDALERDSAHCLFMCTLLELFIYQSPYLSTFAGSRVKIRGQDGISLKSASLLFECSSTIVAGKVFEVRTNVVRGIAFIQP